MSITGTQLTFAVPAAPAQRHSQTSRAAAERIEPQAGTLRRRVLDWLRECGEKGATDEEMQIGLSMNPSTQRPRRIELESMGWIVRTTQTRKTLSGRDAVVYRATGETPVQVQGGAR
jgi:hypothetical protein